MLAVLQVRVNPWFILHVCGQSLKCLWVGLTSREFQCMVILLSFLRVVPMLIFLVPLGLVRFSREDVSISLMDGKGLCASTLQAK